MSKKHPFNKTIPGPKNGNQKPNFFFWCSWLVVLFYGISTLFGLFNAKSSHFDIQFLTVLAVA